MAASVLKRAAHAIPVATRPSRAATSKVSNWLNTSAACRAQSNMSAFRLSGDRYLVAGPPISFIGGSSVVTTGQPQACASIMGHPNPSARLGKRKARARE